MNAAAGSLQHRTHKGDGRALAVGSGHMDCRRDFIFCTCRSIIRSVIIIAAFSAGFCCSRYFSLASLTSNRYKLLIRRLKSDWIRRLTASASCCRHSENTVAGLSSPYSFCSHSCASGKYACSSLLITIGIKLWKMLQPESQIDV